MRRWIEAVANRGAVRAGPVTDPLRIMVIDPDVFGAAALSRAIDFERDMAVVGQSRDLRRAAGDVVRCAPDLVAVRLSVDDGRCRDLLAALATLPADPCVVVLGQAGEPASASEDAAGLVLRLRAVATAALDRGSAPTVVVTGGLPVPSGRLH